MTVPMIVLHCVCGQSFVAGREDDAITGDLAVRFWIHHAGQEHGRTDEAGAALARAHDEAVMFDALREFEGLNTPRAQQLLSGLAGDLAGNGGKP